MIQTATFRILPTLLAIFGLSIDAITIAQEVLKDRLVATIGDVVPPGNGQLETAPALFNCRVDAQSRTYYLNGQRAHNGKLILTASNGFFDKGTCRAYGESSLPKIGDEALIKPNFACLGDWKRTDGTIRWHVWLPQPGVVRLNVHMRVTQGEAGSELTVSLAGKTQAVTTVESTPDAPQPWNLAFDVDDPGEHTLELSATRITRPASGVGELCTIDMFGPALNKAQLLRARWRPAAVHGRYASSTTGDSRMWVMTTRSECDFSSYSPITTPFGYFGTSFESDRRTKGTFNFSMWAARAGGAVPPLEQMPHLLAAGSPDAEFSGFGHEGSGVKLRGWTPMPDRPKVCVQALRVESEGDYDTYHGYFWDHPSRRWKLYAVGRKWNGGKTKTHLSPGSFCEIPGPPHIQRSGDRIREVRRRGWHYGEDDSWHAMDTFHFRFNEPSNKFWYTTADGEFAMGTGGMRCYEYRETSKPGEQKTLPEFLTPDATKQLYQLPAELNATELIAVGANDAIVNLSMTRSGPHAKAEIFYGETDCLTFRKRRLHGTERDSAVSKSTQSDDRSWSQSVKIESLHDGNNQTTLVGLKPDTTYYYRALVTNDEGQVWSFETQEFRTK